MFEYKIPKNVLLLLLLSLLLLLLYIKKIYNDCLVCYSNYALLLVSPI